MKPVVSRGCGVYVAGVQGRLVCLPREALASVPEMMRPVESSGCCGRTVRIERSWLVVEESAEVILGAGIVCSEGPNVV